MMKKVVLVTAALLLCGGVAFGAMGGLAWIDALGLRGAERQARSRIAGYWNARLDNDVNALAEFVHPAETMIIDPGMLVTEAYELRDVAVEGDEAVAKVWLRSRIKHAMFSGKTRELEIADHWTRFRGQWYKTPGPNTIKDAIDAQRGLWKPPHLEEAPKDAAPHDGAPADEPMQAQPTESSTP
jgi:hypothetical protein